MISPFLRRQVVPLLLPAVLLPIQYSLPAADWPQYHGPSGDKHAPGKISKNWPTDGPKAIWKVPMNNGFSSLTVAGGRALTIVMRNIEGADMEVIVALDANTGKEQWAFTLGAAGNYQGGGNSGAPGNDGGDGPRSTPSVSGNRVYVYSSKMVLACLDAETGKEVWTVDIVKQHAGKNINWLSAASPLVEGNLVFVVGGGAGQSLLAFDKTTGRVAWHGEDDGLTHATPLATTLHGVRQVVFFASKGLVGVEPETGKVLWRQPHAFRTSAAMTPVVSGDLIYFSTGYGVGATVYQVSKTGDAWTTKQVWQNNRLENHWSTPVSRDGYVYGLYGHNKHGQAPLQCVELATGKVMWTKEGFGPGGLILADDHLAVLSDAGQVVLIEATPVEYREAARAKVLSGKCWSTPTLSNGRLYVRSTKEGACLDLSPSMAAR